MEDVVLEQLHNLGSILNMPWRTNFYLPMCNLSKDRKLRETSGFRASLMMEEVPFYLFTTIIFK